MSRKIKFGIALFVITLLLVALPMSALADEESPPPETSEATEAPPLEDESLPNEPSPADVVAAEPVPEETDEPAPVAPTEDEGVTAPAPANEGEAGTDEEEPQPGSTGGTEALAELPEDTNLVVLDENGAPEPLVTQAAEDAILEGDPVWCPAGQIPTPGQNGCTPSYTNMTDLLAHIGDPGASGTIWIQSGTISDSSPIVLDGNNYTNWDTYSLTLQGGWSGVSGDRTIGANSVFTVPIVITNWQDNVTVNNLTVQNAPGTGLHVDTSGNINMRNVTANGNGLVDEDGGWGIEADAGGSLSANSITTNDNNMGAYFGATGDVSLSNLIANNNQWLGVAADSNGHQVTVSGTNSFDGNRGDSLYMVMRNGGNIYVQNINVANSGGVHLETWNGAVTLTGTNIFTNNTMQGHVVYINATGDVLVEGVSSNGGGAIGNASGALIITPGNITVSNSSFQNNIGYGLEAGYQAYNDTPAITPASLTMNNVTFANNALGDCRIIGEGVVSSNPFHECAREAAIEIENGSANENPAGGQQVQQPGLGLPLQQIDMGSLAAGTPVALDCGQYSGALMRTASGNQVTVFCPAVGEATLLEFQESDPAMPGALPEGATFLSALSATLLTDGIPQALPGDRVAISFAIPSGANVEGLSILYWDGAAWVNLAEATFTDGKIVYESGREEPVGFFTAEVNFTGVFVLVEQ
ncbi:MAG: hypothetical protein ACOYYJ_17085 [Chloroflexota bacterium]